MDKPVNGPMVYDFHSKALYDAAHRRQQQASDHNFKGVPAEIVGVDDYETLQCVDVKVSINDKYIERDNETLKSITLKKKFVSLPFAGGCSISLPVAIGDPVRLEWAHRDLGKYLDGDGSDVDLSVHEIAQIEDCWVTLGGGTRKRHTNPSLTDIVVTAPKTEMRITPEGNITTITEGTSLIKSFKHTIDAPETIITGNLTVEGDTETQGDQEVGGTTTLDGLLTATSGVKAPFYDPL